MFFYFCAIIKGYDKNPDQKPILPAMYVQLSLDVSISQKYWRMFLRKVNMAFLEMGSLFKFPEHTRLIKKKLPGKEQGKCAGPACTIGFFFPFWRTSTDPSLSGFLLSEDKPWWEDLKVSLSGSPRLRAKTFNLVWFTYIALQLQFICKAF